MFPVKPIAGQQPSGLEIRQGQCFQYALPAGWRVGEDGQFALTLLAPDNKALTVMVGNSGLPANYPPGRFVWDTLMALRPEYLQLGQPRQAAPVAGFTMACEFDVSYFIQGVPCRGIAKCHIQPAYDCAVMAITAALSEASQWPGYSSWLPLIAEQVSATNGAAFGRRGIMAQNLHNSMAFAEAARQYRDWSAHNWQQVTDQRNAAVDRQNFHFRENLGGIQTYTDPFGNTPPVEMPGTYQYYWTDRSGNYVGTDDPGIDPNAGSSAEWRRMPRFKPSP